MSERSIAIWRLTNLLHEIRERGELYEPMGTTDKIEEHLQRHLSDGAHDVDWLFGLTVELAWALAENIYGIDENFATPFVEQKARRSAGGKKRGQAQKQAKEQRYKEWQAQADDVWANRPNLSKQRVAELILTRMPDDGTRPHIDTLRRAIKPPTP
jgi:hypothetical protein